jgi:RecA-family ATPase
MMMRKRASASTCCNHLCVKYGVTVIMPAHPSQTGKNTGSGESGSVQWNNGVRQRLYFSKPKADENEPDIDSDIRQLEVMKSNWSASGDTITVRWTRVTDEYSQSYGGVFVEDDVVQITPATGEGEVDPDTQKRLQETAVEEEFLNLLRKETAKKSWVSAAPTAHNYAPTIFSRSSIKYRGKKGKPLLVAAMDRLFEKKRIHSVDFKSSGHMRSRIEETAK